MEVSQSGIGLLIFDGSNGGASNLDIDNVSIAVLSRGVSSFTVDSMRVDDSSLLLDAINSDGLEIDDVVGKNLLQHANQTKHALLMSTRDEHRSAQIGQPQYLQLHAHR